MAGNNASTRLRTKPVLPTIDAKENRDVATVDIPGAFMQSDMNEEGSTHEN